MSMKRTVLTFGYLVLVAALLCSPRSVKAAGWHTHDDQIAYDADSLTAGEQSTYDGPDPDNVWNWDVDADTDGLRAYAKCWTTEDDPDMVAGNTWKGADSRKTVWWDNDDGAESSCKTFTVVWSGRCTSTADAWTDEKWNEHRAYAYIKGRAHLSSNELSDPSSNDRYWQCATQKGVELPLNPTDPNDGKKTDPSTVEVEVGYGLNPPNVTFNISASLKWNNFSPGNRELVGSETSEYHGPCDRNWSQRCNNPPVNVKAQHYAEAYIKFGGDSGTNEGDASATAEVEAKSTDFTVN